jgi:hypothetical protein
MLYFLNSNKSWLYWRNPNNYFEINLCDYNEVNALCGEVSQTWEKDFFTAIFYQRVKLKMKQKWDKQYNDFRCENFNFRF